MLFEPGIFHTLMLLVVTLQFLCIVVHLSFHSLPVSEGWITKQAKANFKEEQNNYKEQKEHKHNKQSHRGSKLHTDDKLQQKDSNFETTYKLKLCFS